MVINTNKYRGNHSQYRFRSGSLGTMAKVIDDQFFFFLKDMKLVVKIAKYIAS